MTQKGTAPTRAELDVIAALRQQLTPQEVLLTSVRLTDSRGGDVEIDVLVLFPDLGAAVIEVKGGHVEYVDGEWTTSRGRYRRTIHPVDQGRRGKHALRRFLDRQPEWQAPLLRSDWFVAMPHTEVNSDLGPEGAREHLIGAGQLGNIREIVRHRLASTLNSDPYPRHGWHEDALSMLLRTGATSAALSRSKRSAVALTAVLTTAVLAAGVAWLSSDRWMSEGAGVSGSACQEGYEPCLPIVEDLDCSDIRVAVRVTGSDPYGLDRNRDGVGCESYAVD